MKIGLMVRAAVVIAGASFELLSSPGQAAAAAGICDTRGWCACISNGTTCEDLDGDPFLQAEYACQAVNANAHWDGTCGFDESCGSAAIAIGCI